MSIDKDLLDQLMEGRKPDNPFGKDGILQELTKALEERALSTELDAHLTEERADPPPEGANQAPNRRIGTSPKTVTTDSGKVVLNIPRDRIGSFDPLLIAKYQRRFPGFDTKIIHCPAVHCQRQCHEKEHVRARHDDPGNPGPYRGDKWDRRHRRA